MSALLMVFLALVIVLLVLAYRIYQAEIKAGKSHDDPGPR